MSYPEHEKLAEIKDQSQTIGEFLEWCNERGWRLAEWDESRKWDDRMMPIHYRNIDVLAIYLASTSTLWNRRSEPCSTR